MATTEAEFGARLQELLDSLSDVSSKSADQRRAAYSRLELLRMDYEEQPGVADLITELSHAKTDAEREKVKATDKGARLCELLSRFDAARQLMVLRRPAGTPPLAYLRLIITLMYLVAVLPISALVLPVRLLHPLLRRLGVKNHLLPLDVWQKYIARGFLASAGVRVKWEGLENIIASQGTIGMFSHASNLDPWLVGSGPLYFKWIGKKSVFMIPVLGWLMTGWGHIAIDRKNRERAIKSLKSAADKIKRYDRSIAVFPEGTRSKTGQLMPFKAGAFHTAISVQQPITPMIITNAYEIWPSQNLFGNGGEATVRVLEPIQVEKSDTYKSLQRRVRRAMLRATLEPSDRSKQAKHYTWIWMDRLWLPFAYLVLYAVYQSLKARGFF